MPNKIFEMMKNGMEANDPFHGLRIPALLCQDESIWKYFAPDDKIPELEGKTLKELDKPQGTAYRRLYLSSCLYSRIHH